MAKYNIGLAEEVNAAMSVGINMRPAKQARDWQSRWEQVKTGLAAIDRERSEPLSATSIHAARQELHAFYVQTYHLKDALVHESDTLGLSREVIENAVTASPALALIADLANLEKHAALQRGTRSGHVPHVVDVSGETGPGALGWRLKLAIEHDGKSLDGIDVARKAVREWEGLFRVWGLT